MRKLITLLAAAALPASLAGPADARGRHHRDRADIGLGEAVAGAVAAVGVAALVSAIGEAKRGRQDAAVDTCSDEAENRTGGRVFAILHVGKRKGYYFVEGAFDAEGDVLRDTFTCTVRHGAIYDFETNRA